MWLWSVGFFYFLHVLCSFFAIYIVHDKTNLAGKFNVYAIIPNLDLNSWQMGLQTLTERVINSLAESSASLLGVVIKYRFSMR